MHNFKFDLTDADYHEFNRFHVEQSWINRKTSPFIRWFVPIFFAVMFLVRFASEGFGLQIVIHGVLLAIVSTIWLLTERRLSSFVSNLFIKLAISSAKRDGKLPYGKSTQIIFYDDYFHEITENSEAKINYSSLERVLIGPTAVYIYMTAISAMLLPHRVFESETQKAEIIAFVSAKINAAKNNFATINAAGGTE